jgi:hypothetical protein
MEDSVVLDGEMGPSLSMRVADLDVEVNDIAGVLNVQHGRLVDTAIALLDDDRLWFGSGMTTVANWLVWRAGISPSTALAVVKVAERSSDLPETVAALRRGELSLDQSASIARKAPSWCDEQARDYGRLMTVPQLRTVLGSYPYPVLDDDGREIRNPDPDPEEASDAGDIPAHAASVQSPGGEHDPLQDEWCSITIDDEGMYRLSAGLHPENGNIVQNALDAARDRLFNDGGADVDLVDALRLVAEQSLDSEPDQRRRARFTTSVNIDVTGGGMIDTTGWRVPDSLRRYITCDGMLSPTFIDEGKPVSVGRSQYVVPQRTRTVIEHRDRGRCRVPGCTARFGLEVHHIVHWEYDGPTDTWNLVLICGKHHRMHHRGRLGIEGNADESDGLEFRNAHGRIIPPSGAAPNPATDPPLRPDEPYQHPDGGRLDKRFVYFQPPAAHIHLLRTTATSDTEYLNRLAPPWMN